MDSYLFPLFYMLVVGVPLVAYVQRQRQRDARAREASAKGELYSEAPRGQHPQIDVTSCIGCQACTSACPEGHVLGMVGGKAALLSAYKCIGHGLCAEACPVGAISLKTASPGVSSELPYLTDEYETTVPGLFIAGELGGLALIKNAVRQGRDCVDCIAGRVAGQPAEPDVLDVIIVGAGPAGLTAALRAIERGLKYLVIERDTIGGTIAKYPRQKLVMTSPLEFPLYKRMNKLKLSKEALLEFLCSIGSRPDFNARLNENVEDIRREESGTFSVKTSNGRYRARAIILAAGRSGTPKKLGVPGEELPHVMYRLIEADHYTHKKILVVGGGDSAVEAAMGLAMQPGNTVTLSYRRGGFSRIKERNLQRIERARRDGQVRVLFNSNPLEFREKSVLIDVEGTVEELANDYVWVFAGGVAPTEFLTRIGVGFGPKDLTAEVSRESLAVVG